MEDGRRGEPEEGDGQAAEDALIGLRDSIDAFTGEGGESVGFATDDRAETLPAGGEETEEKSNRLEPNPERVAARGKQRDRDAGENDEAPRALSGAESPARCA